jgi:hypothetical protein
MGTRDSKLIAEAYIGIHREGVIDSLKKTGAGIAAGAKAVGTNLAGSAYQALGGKAGPKVNVGSAVAQAQHKSLFGSFIKKANKEITDFMNDAKKMVPGGDLSNIASTYPDIDQKIKAVQQLLVVLQQQEQQITGKPAAGAQQQAAPAPTPQPTQQQPAPTPAAPAAAPQQPAPAATTPAAPVNNRYNVRGAGGRFVKKQTA